MAVMILVAVALSSCTKDSCASLDIESGREVCFTTTSSIVSRSLSTDSFSEGDMFGIFMVGSEEYVNVEYSYDTDGTLKATDESIKFDNPTTDQFYAYSPFDKDNSISKIAIDVSERQDLLVTGATGVTADADGGSAEEVALTFSHALSLLQITTTFGDMFDEDCTVSIYLQDVPTTATYDLTATEDSPFTIGEDVESVTLTEDNGCHEAILIPSDYSSTMVYFKVTTADGVIYTLRQSLGEELKAGVKYAYSAKLGNDYVEFTLEESIEWSDDKSFELSDFDIYYDLSNETYYVYTASGLTAFAELVNGSANSNSALSYGGGSSEDGFDFGNTHLSANCKLMADVDLNRDISNQWTPIGNYSSSNSLKYTGTFDGGGYQVSTIFISSTASYKGLFGYIDGATIKNVGVGGSSGYIQGYQYVGGIVGRADNSIISNCYQSDHGIYTLSSSNVSAYMGGIVGYADNCTITNCRHTSSIGTTSSSYGDYVGGIVGYATSSSGTYINQCYNSGNIYGDSGVGGIVGYSKGSSAISTSILSSYVQITNCYNIGTIDPNSNIAGGIVGNSYGYTRVVNCYNQANVNAGSSSYSSYPDYSGGIVGSARDNTYIYNCYNTGLIASGNGGGLIGTHYSSTYLYYSYYNTSNNTSAVNTAQVNISANTSVGYTSTTMQGESFKNTLNSNCSNLTSYSPCTWQYNEGDYPSLIFEESTSSEDLNYQFELGDDGYYKIYSGFDLWQFAELVNSGNNEISGRLMCNIDLNGSESNMWMPIGTNSNNFKGRFDGDGKRITGLYINATDTEEYSDYVNGSVMPMGLFGYSYGATITNLSVGGTVKNPQKQRTAIITGSSEYLTITNCTTLAGSIVEGYNQNIAGIAGYTKATAFTGCINRADVTGEKCLYIGGITGYVSPDNGSTFDSCVNYGTLIEKGDDDSDVLMGGIAAWLKYGQIHTVINCANYGEIITDGCVSDQNCYVGGITGENQSSYIVNSYNRGAISCNANGTTSFNNGYFGGIAGSISNCSTATYLENCYNAGVVSGGVYCGTLVGISKDQNSITACYYNSSLGSNAIASKEGSDDTTGIIDYSTYMTSGTLLSQLNSWISGTHTTPFSSDLFVAEWYSDSEGYPKFNFVD